MTDVEKATLPRLRLGEMGFTGLKQRDGYIQEECRRELRFFPHGQKLVRCAGGQSL